MKTSTPARPFVRFNSEDFMFRRLVIGTIIILCCLAAGIGGAVLILKAAGSGAGSPCDNVTQTAGGDGTIKINGKDCTVTP